MSRLDPQGTLVVELRANTDFTTLGVPIMNITGNDLVGVPGIRVDDLGSAVWPPGAVRSPLREYRYAIHCVVAKGRTADIDAKAIARAVVDTVHRLGWRTREFSNGDRLAIANSVEESTGGVVADPDTGDIDVTVLAAYRTGALAL